MRLQHVAFSHSAASPDDFPRDDLRQVIFAGRSNVGKSSTINALVGQKGFARVSAKPGKTVFVNFFSVANRFWLVDLPGYGYSDRSKQEQKRYSNLIESYLQLEAASIARLYLIVDIRHKPTENDKTMRDWARACAVPVTVVANKLDKLKPGQIQPALALVKQTLKLGAQDILIPFSAEKGTNADLVIQNIYDSIGLTI